MIFWCHSTSNNCQAHFPFNQTGFIQHLQMEEGNKTHITISGRRLSPSQTGSHDNRAAVTRQVPSSYGGFLKRQVFLQHSTRGRVPGRSVSPLNKWEASLHACKLATLHPSSLSLKRSDGFPPLLFPIMEQWASKNQLATRQNSALPKIMISDPPSGFPSNRKKGTNSEPSTHRGFQPAA